jgi:hypothetical protein
MRGACQHGMLHHVIVVCALRATQVKGRAQPEELTLGGRPALAEDVEAGGEGSDGEEPESSDEVSCGPTQMGCVMPQTFVRQAC